MSRLTLEYYKNIAEISSYEKSDSPYIEYHFKPGCDGFVNIGSKSFTVSGGLCVIDVARLTDSEIFPTLILADRKISLPAMTKSEGVFVPKIYDSEFIRELSLSRLQLTKRLDELEERLNGLSKRVYRTTIF